MPSNTQPEKENPKSHHNNWSGSNLPLLVAGIVVVILILMAGAFAIGRHANYWGRPYMMQTKNIGWFGGPEGGVHRMGGLMNTSDRVAGVVTQVNGSHFTLASNGATKDVETNSSTQYQGGSSVAVNDTVMAFGATSNNQFTASWVQINP